MRTKQLVLILIATLAGAGAVRAAEGEARRIEKRVVVATAAPGDPAGEAVTFLGVAVGPAEAALTAQLRLPAGQGLVVLLVEPESPAGKAGLKTHDVLTKLDDQILIEPRQLSVLVRSHRKGHTITLTYWRAGAEARATASLDTHVVGPATAFTWSGRTGGDAFFHTEAFGPSAGGDLWTPGLPLGGGPRL